MSTKSLHSNTLGSRRNEQHFAGDIFTCIFFKENVWISIKILLKFVLKGSINSIGSGNGLAPSRRQAIIWHIYASLGPNEFNMVAITYTCHKSLLVNDHPKETRTLGEAPAEVVSKREIPQLLFLTITFNGISLSATIPSQTYSVWRGSWPPSWTVGTTLSILSGDWHDRT